MGKVITAIIFCLLSTAAYADPFSDFGQYIDDWLSGTGRSSQCTEEGQRLYQGEQCCQGLQEKFDSSLWAKVCERQTPPESASIPAQTQREYCSDDLYCQYTHGAQWKCDIDTNRCFDDSYNPQLAYPETDYISRGVTGTEYQPETPPSYQGAAHEDDPYTFLACKSTKECNDRLGLKWACDFAQKQCVELIGTDESSYCITKDDCELTHGYGWTCDGKTAKCINNYCSRKDYDMCYKLGNYWMCNPEVERCISAEGSVIRGTIFCSNSQDCRSLGPEWSCEADKHECIKYSASDESSYCIQDSDCWKSHGLDWSCDKLNGKCTLLIETEDYSCSNDFQCEGLGEGWTCDEKLKQCVAQKQPADMVFIPLNYGQEKEGEFIQAAQHQLDYYRQAAPSSCQRNNIAFLSPEKCTERCAGACNCIFKAAKCAIENGFISAEKITGIINPESLYPVELKGCALFDGAVATITGYIEQQPKFSHLLAHEIGHTYGLCHVEICERPLFACKFGCPNVADCSQEKEEKRKDLMSYCHKNNSVYAPAAYSHMEAACTRISGNQQQIIQAYVVTDSGGSRIESLHIGYGAAENDQQQGNYILAAYDEGRQIFSDSFDIQLSALEETIGENGVMHGEEVKLDEAGTVVDIPYSPDIDELKITSNGRDVTSVSMADILRERKVYAETDVGRKEVRISSEDALRIAGADSVADISFSLESGSYIVSEQEQNRLFGFIPWFGTHVEERHVDAFEGTLAAEGQQRPWWQFWG